jgi:hypothetical protein
MDNLMMIETKFQALSGRLDEATLRIWAATEARSLGRGGVSAVAKQLACRGRRFTGLAELKAAFGSPEGQVAMRPGHGFALAAVAERS